MGESCPKSDKLCSNVTVNLLHLVPKLHKNICHSKYRAEECNCSVNFRFFTDGTMGASSASLT